MRTALSFDDVLLEPKGSNIESRKEINLSCRLDNKKYYSNIDKEFYLKYKLPIISAPMDTVTGGTMAYFMGVYGGLGVIHRYNSIEEQIKEFKTSYGHGAIAIGVKGDYKERVQELYKEGCRIFCIDVAHGFHSLVKKAITYLRETYGENIHIMAGNIATSQACECLANWGADSVRIGIGGGSICSTRLQTGHGIPTFQSVYDCAHNWKTMKGKNITKIADGGIRNSGDIVKALAAGADFVMLGSLLAGTDESPGEIIKEPVPFTDLFLEYKKYRGMASKDAQENWTGYVNSEEGISVKIPYKGHVIHILDDLEKGIRSGLSYSGARNILELQATKEFIIQTSSGKNESFTHILNSGGKL